jgi:hypothetical protein
MMDFEFDVIKFLISDQYKSLNNIISNDNYLTHHWEEIDGGAFNREKCKNCGMVSQKSSMRTIIDYCSVDYIRTITCDIGDINCNDAIIKSIIE